MISTSLPGPRYSTGTTHAPVSRRPRCLDAASSYVAVSPVARMAHRLFGDESGQRPGGTLFITKTPEPDMFEDFRSLICAGLEPYPSRTIHGHRLLSRRSRQLLK